MVNPTRIPLLGRDAELRQVIALVESAAAGRGGVLLLQGEAGIGKSRLIEEALAAAAALGLPTWRAAAEELDSLRPFGAIAAGLGFAPRPTQAHRDEVARLLFGDIPEDTDPFEPPGPAPVEMPTEFRLVEAIVAHVEDLCANGPMVLAVDDLQWADPGTLHVLHRLGRLVDGCPLLLCGAFRPAPRPPELSRLVRGLAGRGATSLDLAPLVPAAATDLLAAVLGVAPGPKLVRQAATTGGNPFYIGELVAALRASGSLRETTTAAEVDSEGIPTALKLTVLLELSFLSEPAQSMLRTASVLGSSFTVDALALAEGTNPVALAPRLREATQAAVLQEDGDRMAFRHDLLREALYSDIPRSLRMGMHLHVARVLASAGASPMDVAGHFVRGAAKGDTVALDWLRRAAGEAMHKAPATGADLVKGAIDLFEAGDPGRDALLADYLTCLEGLARYREGYDVARDLLTRRQPPATEARIRSFLARHSNRAGLHDQALAEAAEAEAVPGLSRDQRARIAGNSSTLLLYPPRPEQAEAMALRAQRMADEGDQVTLATAAYTLATVAMHRGRFAEVVEWAAKAHCDRDNWPESRFGLGWRHLNQLSCLLASQAWLRLDRVDRADQALTTAAQSVRVMGFGGLIAAAQALAVIRNFIVGDWDDAVTEYDALVDLMADIGDDHFVTQLGAGPRALVALHRGEPETAQAVAASASAEGGADRGPQDRHLLVLTRALLAESAGSPALALRILADGWDEAVGAKVAWVGLALGPDLVRLARAHGDFDRAFDACRQVEAVVAANPGVASIAGVGLRCRGLADDDVEVLLAAVAAFRDSPRPLDRALAIEDAADALGRAGELTRARPLFDEALGNYEQLGAAWDVARARARMRGLGVRRGSRHPHVRATTGWGALTRGELAVVELVAEGLSNPEVADRLFLSRHTVKRHLANSMLKLGLSSRQALARVAVGPRP